MPCAKLLIHQRSDLLPRYVAQLRCTAVALRIG
jgi:hypothetical protein